jgi:uncharacterized protein
MRLAAMAVSLMTAVASPSLAAGPSFDCSKAETAGEKLICKDDGLAALDRELARLYAVVKAGATMPDDRRKALVAAELDWIKRRDRCSVTDDPRFCMVDAYAVRIHELRRDHADARTGDAEGISTGPFDVRCDGFEAPIGLTFIKVDPPLAYLEWPDDFRVLTLGRSASGSRYAADDKKGETVFWIKGDEAMFDLPGRDTLTCTLRQPG